jgi:hypothetical protein
VHVDNLGGEIAYHRETALPISSVNVSYLGVVFPAPHCPSVRSGVKHGAPALEPKTRHRKAPIPVIAQLAQRLDRHRGLSGSPKSGLMFPNPVRKPLNLDALARDVIVPRLSEAVIKWQGWHAFRRGLVTNLHRVGVADKVIQRILRHSNVAVTQGCYIKTRDLDASAAMEQFEQLLEHAPTIPLPRTDEMLVM